MGPLRTWVQCLMARLLDGRKVGLFRLEKKQLRGDLTTVTSNESVEVRVGLFSQVTVTRQEVMDSSCTR